MSLHQPVQFLSTSRSVYFRVAKPSTGLEGTLAFGDAGITAEYLREGSASVPITLKTQTEAGAFDAGGLVHCGGGLVRLDVPDLAWTNVTTQPKAVHIFVYGLGDEFCEHLTVPLVDYNPNSASTPANVAAAIADLVLSGHTTAGTAAKAWADAASGGSAPTAVEIRDELLTWQLFSGLGSETLAKLYRSLHTLLLTFNREVTLFPGKTNPGSDVQYEKYFSQDGNSYIQVQFDPVSGNRTGTLNTLGSAP